MYFSSVHVEEVDILLDEVNHDLLDEDRRLDFSIASRLASFTG